MTPPAHGPVLVTGLPRSGTTWLAQQLASSPRTAMTGREPMNPRGRQFALRGSVSSWVRLDRDPSPRQARTLRRVYRGWEPRVYSRYGVRQWAAPLPWVRVVVKDPFALLSLPAITRATGARPVILYRHPAAVLASYRRLNWLPDVAEIAALGLPDAEPSSPVPTADDDVSAMGWFWATCYATVLRDLPKLPDALVVDHAALAAGEDAALAELGAALGIRDLRPHHASRLVHGDRPAHPRHDLDRRPAKVAEAWRQQVSPDDIARIEACAGAVHRELVRHSLPLPEGNPHIGRAEGSARA
jgi:sulfotransferase family protein